MIRDNLPCQSLVIIDSALIHTLFSHQNNSCSLAKPDRLQLQEGLGSTSVISNICDDKEVLEKAGSVRASLCKDCLKAISEPLVYSLLDQVQQGMVICTVLHLHNIAVNVQRDTTARLTQATHLSGQKLSMLQANLQVYLPANIIVLKCNVLYQQITSSLISMTLERLSSIPWSLYTPFFEGTCNDQHDKAPE